MTTKYYIQHVVLGALQLFSYIEDMLLYQSHSTSHSTPQQTLVALFV